jgi:hypothetical protein
VILQLGDVDYRSFVHYSPIAVDPAMFSGDKCGEILTVRVNPSSPLPASSQCLLAIHEEFVSTTGECGFRHDFS